ncbi:MAG: Ca-activated chloride channel family protein [Verrucomicrobiales bacterium]|jgi:Ca-activated chloride channel family protein
MIAELVAIAVVILFGIGEILHLSRVRRLASLAFGPHGKPALWVGMVPVLRPVAAGLLCWGLITLWSISPRVYKAKAVEDEDFRHIIIALDVSPSMKLEDAGVDGKQRRSLRAFDLMQSFFKRVSVDQMRLSLVAFYTEALPVVVDTKDPDIIRNFLEDMDMYQAFENGSTEIFKGLEESARIAKDEGWKAGSATLVVISDGDSVPATGMPKMPPSIRDVVVVGVGDSRVGKFIDGRQSRQDSSALRQIALRLGGTYHDGNTKHLKSELLASLTDVETENPLDKLSKREYALAACGLGAFLLAILPILLQLIGTSWRPGRRVGAGV